MSVDLTRPELRELFDGPKGRGGWLLVLAAYVGAQGLYALYTLVQTAPFLVPDIAVEVATERPAAATFLAALTVLTFGEALLSAGGLLLLLRGSSRTPAAMRLFVTVGLAAAFLEVWGSGRFADLYDERAYREAVQGLGLQIVAFLVVMAYLHRSRRVRNTFHVPKPDARASD